jgi:hypothetical protein
VGTPAVASAQATIEFEFHMSPVANSSRPQTGRGTRGSASSSARATTGSSLSRTVVVANARSGIDVPHRIS